MHNNNKGDKQINRIKFIPTSDTSVLEQYGSRGEKAKVFFVDKCLSKSTNDRYIGLHNQNIPLIF